MRELHSDRDQLNNTKIAARLDKIIGGILDCRPPQINNLARSVIGPTLLKTHPHIIIQRFSVKKNSALCFKTRQSVVKTIRMHLNGIIPWIGKHPTLKVTNMISILNPMNHTFLGNSSDPRPEISNQISTKNRWKL